MRSRPHVAAETGVAAAALVAAQRLTRAALAHAIGGQVIPRTATRSRRGGRLTVRAHHAVAAAHAGAELADLPRRARLADAAAVLAQPVAGVAGQTDRAGELAVVAEVAADALAADLVGGTEVVALVDHAVAVVVDGIALLRRRLDHLAQVVVIPPAGALGDARRRRSPSRRTPCTAGRRPCTSAP